MITTATEADLPDLLLLMRGYCDFYEVDPSDDALLAMSRTLIADPEFEGVQLIARDDDGQAVGFATIFWMWTTLSASRLALMNDLFVVAAARGATALVWQTAHDNARAQAVYARVGATRDERWLDYSLDVAPGATTPDS